MSGLQTTKLTASVFSGLCMYWLLSPLMKSCSSVGSVAIGNVEQRWVSVMSAGGSLPMIIVEGWR